MRWCTSAVTLPIAALLACGSPTVPDAGLADAGGGRETGVDGGPARDASETADASEAEDAAQARDAAEPADAGDTDATPAPWTSLLLAADMQLTVHGRDPATGTLTHLESAVTLGGRGGNGVAMHANGRWVYTLRDGQGIESRLYQGVADVGRGRVDVIDREPATPDIDGLIVHGGLGALTLDGDLLAAPEYRTRTVRLFDLDATTGALSATATVTLPGEALSVGFDRRGHLYAGHVRGLVSMTIASARTGGATRQTLDAVAPVHIRMHPTLDVAYVVEETPRLLTTVALGADGSMTRVASLTMDGRVHDLVVSPDGAFVYAGSSAGAVWILRVDPTTGVLSDSGGRAASGQVDGSVSYSISADGRFLYVAQASIQVFARDVASGGLTEVPQEPNYGGLGGLVIVP
jgi:hypothetical protein